MRNSVRKSFSVAEDSIKGPCPFCHRQGGQIICDFNGVGVLIHTLPACETYNRLSADDFVQAVIDRKHYQ